MAALSEQWKDLHETLVNHYRTHEGLKDREWNYYSVFIVCDSSVSRPELSVVRRTIESDTRYSRKFVLLTDELPDLPPGVLSAEKLGSVSIVESSPKRSIENSMRHLIESASEVE